MVPAGCQSSSLPVHQDSEWRSEAGKAPHALERFARAGQEWIDAGVKKIKYARQAAKFLVDQLNQEDYLYRELR